MSTAIRLKQQMAEMQSFSPYGGDTAKYESEGKPCSATTKLEGIRVLKAEHMREGLGKVKVVPRAVVEIMHESWTPGKIDHHGRYPSLVRQLPLIKWASHPSK